MIVTLLQASDIGIADKAIGKCWDKTTDKPEERMYRVGNKFKHASTLEHIIYTFDIDGISRACLQELARHRMQSLSVKSSRYTLGELKDAKADNLWDYFVKTGVEVIDHRNLDTMKNLQSVVKSGVSNDEAKYLIPEAYKTSLVSSMNMRALQNFLKLRTNKAALREIRILAHKMFEVIPDNHKFMLEEFVEEEEFDANN